MLTGWAGQISLGQMAIVAIGAAVSATCTTRWNVDLTLAVVIGAVAGAATAFLIGLPALRLRGLYLAVTTLAFALAVQSWLLNEKWFHWFPPSNQRLARPPLFGRIDVDGATAYYWYTIVVATVIFVAVVGIRRSRTGRVIVAIRDNERAAQSFAVPAVRAKLTAFTISGAIAGVAGALFVHLNQAFSLALYHPGESLDVFVAAVVGGLGSVGGRGPRRGLPARHGLVHHRPGVVLPVDRRRRAVRAARPPRRPRLARRARSATCTSAGCSAAAPRSPAAGRRPAPAPERELEGGHVSRIRRWLRDVCGGEPAYPLVILFGLNAVDELDRTAFGILLPEIRDAFGLDLSTVLGLVAARRRSPRWRCRCRSPSSPTARRGCRW